MPKKVIVDEVLHEVPQREIAHDLTAEQAEAIELDPPQVRVFAINEEQSLIRGGQVFVHVTEFLTIEDRQRHAARHPIMHLMAASVHEAIARDASLMDKLYPLVNRLLLQEQMPSSLPEFEPLIPYGFDPSWVLEPIRIVGEQLLPTGNFDPQPITREFLRQQLLCALGNTQCDCQ